jgi:hypothetical protein
LAVARAVGLLKTTKTRRVVVETSVKNIFCSVSFLQQTTNPEWGRGGGARRAPENEEDK